ncbi:hypothetical protein [Ramlibacter rhizophilus]|uniref:HAD family hydrolase n=1 Tax=Ramlibacter rhizophilus TaxID=1781167 RepID=A0A4Z0BNB6_9BURK|nr:hypothetical protein [Ramlibacter rhizophilus]TFY99923.1 hypothetical protein EZ242_12375 [Ramlibacter rhizophilus]
MNRILYYVEPWIELSPDFRFGAFKDAVFQLAQLKKHAPELDCRLLIGEGICEAIARDGYTGHREFEVGVLHLDELTAVYKNAGKAAEAFLTGASSEDDLERLARLCRRALPGFEPDVVLMHETHAPFISKAYPSSLVLHSMYGMSYRMPLPRLTMFDPAGLYQNSLLARHAADLRAECLPASEAKALCDARNWFVSQLAPHDPTWQLIEPEQSRFDKLLLVPLQVDGYYAFNLCSEFETQAEFLETVLRATPRTWGVVVTEHSEYKPSLGELTVQRLKRSHPNLIYKKELNAIPYVSQFLLAHVDAVATVSSSLALQALVFDCPVIAAGSSHINAVATCDLRKLADVFELHQPRSRDPLLHFFLTRYHWATADHVHDGAGLYALLSSFWNLHESGMRGLELLPAPRSLRDVLERLKHHSQWRAWTTELKKRGIAPNPHPVHARIVFNEAVSFDLFDTLVCRPFVQPHELFQFIEPLARELTGNIYFPFHHLRREAERLARAAHGHRIEVTLDEIYAQLASITSFPRPLLERIKALELKAELALIAPRRGLVRAWKLAGTLGKLRSIITDIYLEEHAIRTLLAKNGFADFDLLFVSATERVRKEDGTIYPKYMAAVRQLQPALKSFLHVGDNARADGEMARRFGIEALVIPKATELLRRTRAAELLKDAFAQPSYDTSILAGMLANRFFSAPSSGADHASLCDGHLFNVGYGVLGPFVLGYVQWVIRRLRAHKVDHAYFLARDAYLVMKVFEEFKRWIPDLPSSSYLYCSRRSVLVPGISEEEDIFEIATLNFGTTTVEKFLNTRFGLNVAELPPKLLREHGMSADGSTFIGYPRDLGAVVRLVTDLKPYIYEKAMQERATFTRYLEQEGATDAGRKSAFVDIGYSGTMQRKISQLTGVDYHGYYMLTHNYVLHYFRDKVFEAWLEEYDSQRAPYKHSFNQFIPLIESLLSSTEGSLLCFRDVGGALEPEYLYASNERERIAFVEGLHAGAISFVKDYLGMFGEFSEAVELSPQVASFIMLRFAEDPAPADVRAFEGLILENMFAGAEFSVISNPARLLNAKGELTVAAMEHLVSESKWKQGARVSYRRYLPAGATATATAPAATKPAATPAVVPRPSAQLDRRTRLRNKLRNTPDRFFLDSKSRLLRPLGYLFRSRVASAPLRFAIRKIVSA